MANVLNTLQTSAIIVPFFFVIDVWREGWREGYAAFTYSVEQIPVVKQYIINQKEHHRQTTFAEEYRRFIMGCGGEIDERFFLKD